MRIETAPTGALPGGTGAVGIPVFAGPDGLRLAVAEMVGHSGSSGSTRLDSAWCKRQGFTGKIGQSLSFHALASAGLEPADAGGTAPAPGATVLVGVGDQSKFVGDAGLEALRRAAAAFVRAVGGVEVAVFLQPDGGAIPAGPGAAAVAEGAVLASYRYDAYRTGEQSGGLERLIVGTGPLVGDGAAEGAARGARVAEAVCMARDLVNEPPSSLTPQKLADSIVERFADVPEVSVEVWDEGRIATERLGALLGVARGSSQPPRLVRVDYQPPALLASGDRVPHVVLVGKGITFDSGGLSLKTAGGMETMKTDMSGAAAVLAAVDALAALGARVRITALTPLTENMPGGSATKPGDVLTARNGKTIEVLNTDAEGRLVLADALSLAVEGEPDVIVDIATLTGAAVVALGKEIGGLMGNDEQFLAEVRAAGDRAGEPLWPLPLPDDYRSHIDSEIADMRNVGRAGQAGSISAALLLREFVGDVRWAHLDIAGPARSDDNSRYLTKGGTGFGVRTLVELLTNENALRWIAGGGTAAADA